MFAVLTFLRKKFGSVAALICSDSVTRVQLPKNNPKAFVRKIFATNKNVKLKQRLYHHKMLNSRF